MACSVCQKTFVLATEDEYDSDTKPHVCATCGQSFSLKIQLKRHTLLHANGDPFTCINCSKECGEDVADDSKSYSTRLSKKGDYTCEICTQTFTSKRTLLRHTNDEHTFDSSYFCDDCPEIFESASDLKKHSATHKSKSVSKKRSSKVESNQGQSSKSLTCPTCDKTFAYQACLDKHVNKCGSEDSTKPSKRKSSYDVSTPPKSSKKSHVEVYENTDKKHECNYCGKSFTRKSALDGHLVTHLQDESDEFYEDNASGNENNEKDHQDSEPKEEKLAIKKSFICIKCNFVCFSQMTLVKHVCRKDNQEAAARNAEDISVARGKENKSYKCSKCSKSFDYAEDLRHHKSVAHPKDTNNKSKERESFECDICDKQFRSKKRLKRHLESHKIAEEDSDVEEVYHKLRRKGHKRKGKDYTCDVCGKRFAGETCLRKHARKHKDGDPPPRTRRKKQKVLETQICSYCDEEFIGKKNQYLKHMHIHTPEVCGICDERFENRQQLREHCKVHVGTEEGKMFMECSQKALDAKNGLLPLEPKIEYIYLVLR